LTARLEEAVVAANELIAAGVYRLVIHAPRMAAAAQPGQFVHLKVNNLTAPLLRRPISIADTDQSAGTLDLIYRIVGGGTAFLSGVPVGEHLDCLGPLGKGFALECERPLLVGGGMGLAPLVYLAKALCPRPITVLMGGRTKDELFWEDVFAPVCDQLRLTTDDGTAGTRGYTVDVLPELIKTGNFDQIYTCGPRPMMEQAARIAKQYNIACQVSLEEYMACGLGGCLACSCAGTDGKRRKVCTEGPVFKAGEVFGGC